MSTSNWDDTGGLEHDGDDDEQLGGSGDLDLPGEEGEEVGDMGDGIEATLPDEEEPGVM